MSTEKIYHYTYRITNIRLNKHYYGKRSSTTDPKLDLGIKYFSSSTNKNFIKDQQDNPQNYKYKIIYIFNSSEKAIKLEIKLHNKFNVGTNKYFYNKVKQTAYKFDTTGTNISQKHKEKLIKSLIGRKVKESTKEKISNSLKGRVFSEETLIKMKKSAKANAKSGSDHPMFGKKHTEESLKKISESGKGRRHSTETKNKMSISRSGKKHYNHKLANIHCYKTNKLVAENIVISVWAKENGYSQANLSATALSDKTKPSTANNRRQHKGVYAVYLD